MSQFFASGSQSIGFNISPSIEHSGLISFRMDWLDLLAVQDTLMSLLQHHSSKASILSHSTFSMVQLSHPFMTTGKTSSQYMQIPNYYIIDLKHLQRCISIISQLNWKIVLEYNCFTIY